MLKKVSEIFVSIVRHALFIERDAAMTPIALLILLFASAFMVLVVYLRAHV